MGKKVARIIGYVFCGLMLAICILMIVTAAAFRSSDVVNVFGFNIFMVQSDDIQTAPRNSAVIVQKCELSDVIKGKLLLYTKGEDKTPTMGYAREYYAEDGVYYIKVMEKEADYTLPESDLVGRADYCSVILGSIILFVKSPFGMFCIAVLPCIALILYDIIKSFAAKLPPPEVVPQVKNMPEEDIPSRSGISVSSDGKGTYSRNSAKTGKAPDDVLFSYAARQKKVEREQRPIIPLTDKKTSEPVEQKRAPVVKPIAEDDVKSFKVEIPSDNIVTRKKGTEGAAKKAAKTEELPIFQKDDTSDAFFTQSKVPQIGKYLSKKPQAAVEEPEDDKNAAFPSRASTKRSSQIIANKRFEDLMKDEDDKRDKNRYEIDDIISGISSKH